MARSSTTRRSATARKTTPTTRSRKAATPKKTTSKTTKAPSAAATEPVVVNTAEPVVAGPELKKAELIEAVVERSGIKKRFAKPALEAALAVLGEALSEGRPLNLMPMGKVKVQKAKDVAGGRVLITRVRQRRKTEEENVPDPLAEAAE